MSTIPIFRRLISLLHKSDGGMAAGEAANHPSGCRRSGMAQSVRQRLPDPQPHFASSHGEPTTPARLALSAKEEDWIWLAIESLMMFR